MTVVCDSGIVVDFVIDCVGADVIVTLGVADIIGCFDGWTVSTAVGRIVGIIVGSRDGC